MSEKELARFWAKVDKSPEHGGCWLWTGAVSHGYGVVGIAGKTLGSHRTAFELHHGPIPEGFSVCHSCDVGHCVNPAHLWLGTHRDNMADMVAKKRSASGDRSAARLHPERCARGERSGGAKLTETEVRKMRADFKSGRTQRDVAREYGISESRTSKIARNKAWKHIKETP